MGRFGHYWRWKGVVVPKMTFSAWLGFAGDVRDPANADGTPWSPSIPDPSGRRSCCAICPSLTSNRVTTGRVRLVTIRRSVQL
eukprot:5040661-Pyramimonas_sp.AAC.2